MNITYLTTMMAKLTSETWSELLQHTSGYHVVL